jgi:hypothetical protein
MATIYKIYCKNSEIKDLYVGSTNDFKQRVQEHISRCNNENSNEYNVKVYKFIRHNGGMENFTIEKIIECDLENQYDKEVEYYLLLNSRLNSKFPRRSKKQYYIDNTEQILEQRKQYYIDNKEYMTDYKKHYYNANKKQLIEQQKEYNAVNKERIQERNKIKIHCDCGSIIRRGDISAHKKSKKHQNYLSTM